jgi:hypothetical protein
MIAQRTHRRKLLLGASATTYLVMCVGFGPDQATWFIVVAAFFWAWYALAKRYPIMLVITHGFITGLFGWPRGYTYGYRRRWR